MVVHMPPDITLKTEFWDFMRIDSIPFINEHGELINHHDVERTEQLIAWKYINPTDSVLELGGRYGTVSCFINNRLQDPRRHVVIEPDKSVFSALKTNRDTHNSFFYIWDDIISKTNKNIIYDGYATRISNNQLETENKVSCIQLEDLYRFHGFGFNVLVADCEGALEDFVRENLDFIKNLRMITYEKDCSETCNYEYIDNILLKFGFINVKDGGHAIYIK